MNGRPIVGVAACVAALTIALSGPSCSVFTSLDGLGSGGGSSSSGSPSGGSSTSTGGGDCGPGLKLCGGQCVSTDDPTIGCGAPDCQSCVYAHAAATCSGGACALGACASSFADCNGSAADGCETSLASDTHCGACDVDCAASPATPFCSAGICSDTACALGTGNCDGDPTNGCETDTNQDAAHCGLCTIACSLPHATPACVVGQCVVGACDGGFGDCDANAANGCESDLGSSANNCGACGHGCLGGPCAQGRCQPLVIAAGQESPWGVAVDDTYVYWSVTGATGVRKRAKNGTGPIITVVSGQGTPWGIALDSTHLFFVDFEPGGRAMQINKDGTGLLPLTSSQIAPIMIAVSGSNVFFSDAGGSTGYLRRVPVGGGTLQSVTGGSSAYGLAADATSVFFCDTVDTIRRYDIASKTVSTFAGGLIAPSGLAVDSTAVYYDNYGPNGEVGKFDKATGGNHVVLASAQNVPSAAIGVDAAYVYFTTEGSGDVMRVTKDGSGLGAIASGQATPVGVTVDDIAVYWATFQASGNIVLLAK